MIRWKQLLILAAAGRGAGAVARRSRPAALAQVSGGLWELSGSPGRKRRCASASPMSMLLAQFEHRGAKVHAGR